MARGNNSSARKWRRAVMGAALLLTAAAAPALARTLVVQTDRGTFDVPIDDINLQFWVEDDQGTPVSLTDADLAVALYVAADRVRVISETDFAALAASLDQVHAWSSGPRAAAALGMPDETALRRALSMLAERTVSALTGGPSLDGQAGATATAALAAVPGSPARALFLTGIAQVAATRDLVNLYLFDRASLLSAVSARDPVSFQLIDRLYAQQKLIQQTARLGPQAALIAGLRSEDGFWRALVDAEGRAGLAALQLLAGDGGLAVEAVATPEALERAIAELYRGIEAARAEARMPLSDLEREVALFNLTEMGVFFGRDALAALEPAAAAPSRGPAAPPAPSPSTREPPPPEAVMPGRFRDCGSCPEMVVVPAGRFTMGAAPSEPGFEHDEGPQHEVEIKRFAIGRFEVTFAEWDACVAAGACTHIPDDEGWGRGNRPVINVHWFDVQVYLDWLSRRTGHRYRLPSEAEWEYAARAGTTTPYWWGDTVGGGEANCAGCGSEWDGRMTAPVGSFAPNPFGLYDMLGNVTEWVADNYRPNYHLAPTDGSAWEAVTVEYYVGRGGSWYSTPLNIRAANRQFAWPWLMEADFGFRVARDL